MAIERRGVEDEHLRKAVGPEIGRVELLEQVEQLFLRPRAHTRVRGDRASGQIQSAEEIVILSRNGAESGVRLQGLQVGLDERVVPAQLLVEALLAGDDRVQHPIQRQLPVGQFV